MATSSHIVTGTLAAVLLLAQLAFEQDADEKAQVGGESGGTLGHIAGMLAGAEAVDEPAAEEGQDDVRDRVDRVEERKGGLVEVERLVELGLEGRGVVVAILPHRANH